MKHRSFRFFIFLGLFGITLLFGAFFLDRILAFSFNQLTGYEVSYDHWKVDLFGRNRVEKMVMWIHDKNVTISADKALFSFNLISLLKKNELFVNCELRGVKFDWDTEAEGNIAPDENIFSTLFSSRQVYDKVVFKFLMNKNEMNVSAARADSRDIRVKGDYSYFRAEDKISVFVEILFSPELTKTFEKDMIENVLSLSDDGWYGTVIDYKGNPTFLLALYALTA